MRAEWDDRAGPGCFACYPLLQGAEPHRGDSVSVVIDGERWSAIVEGVQQPLFDHLPVVRVRAIGEPEAIEPELPVSPRPNPRQRDLFE
jgi:hypothetical protein